MPRSLVYRRIGETFVMRHFANPPGDPAHDDWVLQLKTSAPKRVLIASEVGLTSKQRLDARDAVSASGAQVVLLTASLATLTTIRVLSIFHQGMRAYHPSKLGEAVAALGVPAHERAEVEATMRDYLSRTA